jgi:O-acetyl-ADP-ribose deacetylase (regulator of RNase III)
MQLHLHTGDLFESGLPALAHGCNSRGAMGAGIALQFRERFPDMYREYRRLCEQGVLTLGSYYLWDMPTPGPAVFNLITQVDPGPCASLPALEVSLGMALDACGGHPLGVPLIGGGIGGLARDDVVEVMTRLAEARPSDLHLFEL